MLKKGIQAALSCFFIFSLLPLNAEAQFWKKNKNNATKGTIKEHTEKDIPELIDQENLPDTPALNTRSIPNIRPAIHKDLYQIDVLLPIDLNQLAAQNIQNADRLPPSKKQLIYYIEGMQLAIDTLSKMGVPLDLYIHDVPNIEEPLLNDGNFKGQLSSSDLIVAHLPVSDLVSISEWSQQQEIMLFSTFSPATADIHAQPYFYNLNPKLNSHIESLLTFGQNQFPQDPKFLIYDTSSTFARDTYQQFNDFLGNNAISAFNWQHPKTKESFKASLLPNRKNIIYCNSMEKEMVSSLLQTLKELGDEYEIVIMGMPNWKPFINHSEEANLYFYMTTPFFYDGHGGWSAWLKSIYKKKHGRDITEMTYRGFEIIYSLAINLQKNGNELSQQLLDQHKAWILSPFLFEAKFDKDHNFLYFENSHLNILQYHQQVERIIH